MQKRNQNLKEKVAMSKDSSCSQNVTVGVFSGITSLQWRLPFNFFTLKHLTFLLKHRIHVINHKCKVYWLKKNSKHRHILLSRLSNRTYSIPHSPSNHLQITAIEKVMTILITDLTKFGTVSWYHSMTNRVW